MTHSHKRNKTGTPKKLQYFRVYSNNIPTKKQWKETDSHLYRHWHVFWLHNNIDKHTNSFSFNVHINHICNRPQWLIKGLEEKKKITNPREGHPAHSGMHAAVEIYHPALHSILFSSAGCITIVSLHKNKLLPASFPLIIIMKYWHNQSLLQLITVLLLHLYTPPFLFFPFFFSLFW